MAENPYQRGEDGTTAVERAEAAAAAASAEAEREKAKRDRAASAPPPTTGAWAEMSGPAPGSSPADVLNFLKGRSNSSGPAQRRWSIANQSAAHAAASELEDPDFP